MGRTQKIAWGDMEAADDQIVAITTAAVRLIYDFQIHKAYGGLTT